MTVKDSFEERWVNEGQFTSHILHMKERELMIYTCGWEDGVRQHFKDIVTKSESAIRADERRKCADRAVAWWNDLYADLDIPGIRAAIEKED